MPKGKETKESKIEKIPIEIRKKILWLAVTAIMILVIVLYFIFLSFDTNKIDTESKKSQFKQTADELGEMIFEAKSQFEVIKEKLEITEPQPETATATDATTTPQLTPEVIDIIKQQIENISTSTISTTTSTTTQE